MNIDSLDDLIDRALVECRLAPPEAGNLLVKAIIREVIDEIRPEPKPHNSTASDEFYRIEGYNRAIEEMELNASRLGL